MTSTAALELVVRVSLLYAVAGVLSLSLRRSSAAARHLVWTVAMAGTLLLPVLSIAAPRWEVALPMIRGAAAATPAPVTSSAWFPVAQPVLRLSDRVGAGPGGAAPPAPGSASHWLWPPVLTLWLAGCVLVFARLALGSARMRWIERRAQAPDESSWLRLGRRLANVFGVGDRVVFLEGGPLAMPMTWGLFKPRVLLPASAAEWPIARQRVVLLHELAHVKRRDCLTQLFAQLACAIYWFHPLAWIAARRLRAERERACDDLVLAAGTRGSDYADHLLEIARSLRAVALPTWAAVAMAHRSQLEGRLMAILDPELRRHSPSRRRAALLVSVMAAFVMPVATLTPVPQAAANDRNDADDAMVADWRLEERSVAKPQGSDGVSQSAAVVVEKRAEPSAHAQIQRQGEVREGAADPLAATAPEAIVGGIVEGIVEGVATSIARSAIVQTAGKPPADGVSAAEDVNQNEEDDQDEDEEAPGRRKADPRAVSALLEALKDSDAGVREQAMHALVNLRAPEAIAPLRTALRDPSPDIREQAAFGLGQLRDRESIDALAAALKDDSAGVREQAAFALGEIRDKAAVAPLAAALRDPSSDVREQAAFALGEIGDARAIDALTGALKDSSAEVRRQAAFALGQLSK